MHRLCFSSHCNLSEPTNDTYIITLWQSSARVIKDESESQWNQWKRGEFDPLSPKTPQPIVTKLGLGDYVGNPYMCAKFHHDPVRGFCSPPPRPSARASAYQVTLLVNFFGGSSSSLQPRPLHHRSSRSIRQMTSCLWEFRRTESRQQYCAYASQSHGKNLAVYNGC